MEPIERRLTHHLGEQAAGIEPDDQGVVRVMNEGKRKRTARVVLLGAASCAAVIAVAVAAIAVLGHRQDDSSITPASPSPASGLAKAAEVPASFEWSVEASPQAATQFGGAAWWSGSSSNGTSTYTFGTLPHQPDEKARQQLFTTLDGVDYQPAGLAFDPWISDLDSSQPARIYAIGTVPAGLSYRYQTGVTTDQGATWQLADLPLDLQQIRDDFGAVGTFGTQIVAGDRGAVAVVEPMAFAQGPGGLSIDGVDSQYGTAVTSAGVEVYGAPDDLDAVAARECPPGWPLVKGPAREFVTDGTGPATQATIALGPGGINEWHCESPKGDEPDLWLDPTRVHGDVVQVVPFDQLPYDEGSVKALRGQTRVFHTADGAAWDEVALPTTGGTANGVLGLLWNGSDYALRTPGVAGGELWLSADGTQWRQATLPSRSDGLAFGSLPDGSLLLSGRRDGELVAYVSADGTAWSGVSLDGLLALDPTWRITMFQAVSSPDGTSLLVAAAQDMFAVLGPPVLDHGRYQLRLSDAQGSAELLDGDSAVIDRLDSIWQQGGVTGAGGRLRTNGNGGVLVLDPATGETVDVFAQNEIGAANDKIYNSPQGQRFQSSMPPSAWWVLDTADGTGWSITRVEGLSGNNSWLAAAPQAISGVHSYRFMVGSSTAVVVGRRTP
ncbi:MAG: hypothetical protein WCC60_10685 [Ilumatobacteraceae bacterium]